jgi:hypothetical protein
MTIQLKQKINDLVAIIDGYIDQINALDVKCDNQHDRIHDLLNVLQDICDMQSANYGDATKTHMNLDELCKLARAEIAKVTQ